MLFNLWTKVSIEIIIIFFLIIQCNNTNYKNVRMYYILNFMLKYDRNMFRFTENRRHIISRH